MQKKFFFDGFPEDNSQKAATEPLPNQRVTFAHRLAVAQWAPVQFKGRSMSRSTLNRESPPEATIASVTRTIIPLFGYTTILFCVLLFYYTIILYIAFIFYDN